MGNLPQNQDRSGP